MDKTPFEPRILAFLCNWCAYGAADLAGVSRLQYPSNLRAIRVMCSATVSPHHVLKAFQCGADGVLVGGWHVGDCHYLYGNYMTVKRITLLQELVRFVGLEDRLSLVWISSAEAQKYVRAITEFTEKIRRMGPSPLNLDHGLFQEQSLAFSSLGHWTMDHEIIKQVREWLEQGVVDLFLAYRITDGHPLPHVFTRDSIGEMKELVVGSALYPLEKIAWQLVRLHPEATVGLPVQEGDQRALKVLQAWNQIEERRIKVLPVAAAPSLQEKVTGKVKKALGIAFHADLRDLDRLEPWERFSRWMYEFQKCIKCYGCRNICPVCFCTECSLENADLVGTGRLPPEVPLFHLVRAVHMAGRCTDCGLCEEACPAEIPLRVLYRKVNEIVKEVFGYETGAGSNLSPLNLLGKEVTLEPKPI